MIFEIGNEKGGVGKSSLAIALSAYLAAQKYSVVLVDTDSQKTASKWGELRSHHGLEHNFVIVDKSVDPTEHIRKLSETYDAVVVDVGARDYARLGDLAKIVDLWIAPTRVGQGDLESTAELAYAFEKADRNHKNGKIPLVITTNAVPGSWNSTEGEDAISVLRDALPNVPVMSSMIRDRKVWRDAHKLGRTIFEMPFRDREKAEAEFTAMFNEVWKAYETFQKGVKHGNK
jgi:chromosome partitioning protein